MSNSFLVMSLGFHFQVMIILYFPFYFLPHLFLLLNDNGQSFFRKILTNRIHFIVIKFFLSHLSHCLVRL